MLDVWPALPLAIWCDRIGGVDDRIGGVDNIIAALERRERVCQIVLANGNVQSSNWEIVFEALQQPLPELTILFLWSKGETVPVVPDSFLGGSAAPCLEFLQLYGIPFPGLPKLLLSATRLVTLHLINVPHSGYISPDTMVTVLSTLTSLYSLTLEFESPRSCPDQASRHPPPSTRSVLPILTGVSFKGVTEYLEDLVACIDAPRLNNLRITFFNDIAFDTPQLIQFVARTAISGEPIKAYIVLMDVTARIRSLFPASLPWELTVTISCRGLGWQLSSLEQVCTSCLPLLSTEDLYIYEGQRSPPDWKDDIENGLWLQLLNPFTAVKNLYLSEKFALRIGPALQELVEGRTTEVFPALQNIFLEGFESSGPVQEGIAKFVAARQVASRTIEVSSWANSEMDKRYY